MKYLATCFSHFGAMSMRDLCRKKHLDGTLRPVPRMLSSSCGVCVIWEDDRLSFSPAEIPEEVEQIYEETADSRHPWNSIYTAEKL
ncbi:MAG: DUF3343 domain-containing protein [Solobacterium sp.]|nr:DUF3343 domain-containing protein [Solobacterium sp.]MBR2767922.1 DUF3343 domain-containing protein [Solobacterium sp.]